MHLTDAAGHVNNQFVHEDPTTNRPPTEIDAAWLNAMQNELANVIKGLGLELNKNDQTQLLQAIERGFLRVGEISLQHPILAAMQKGKTYQHTALEVREALGAADGDVSEDAAPSIGWHWGGKLGMRMWMSSVGRLMWGSAAVHDTTTGSTQEQAEVGADYSTWMSPLRVLQAIRKRVVDATEAVAGVIGIATQNNVNNGTRDDVAVTPYKMRLGFLFMPGINGFIALPTWLGGFIVQWGRITATQSAVNVTASVNWSYPTAFLESCFATWAFQHALGGDSGNSLLERLCGAGEPTVSGATFYIADSDNAGSYTLRVFAIGK